MQNVPIHFFQGTHSWTMGPADISVLGQNSRSEEYIQPRLTAEIYKFWKISIQ